MTFPPSIKADGQDLVGQLLQENPSNRLPARPNGIRLLKNHTWFRTMDWERLVKQSFPAPYVPKIRHEKDDSNFRASEQDLPPNPPYPDPGDGWDNDFATVKNEGNT